MGLSAFISGFLFFPVNGYSLSIASTDTARQEFARVAKAAALPKRGRIEERFQRGKSEAGMTDYEVRSWPGWYHHQTLSMMATWSLVKGFFARIGVAGANSKESPDFSGPTGLSPIRQASVAAKGETVVFNLSHSPDRGKRDCVSRDVGSGIPRG